MKNIVLLSLSTFNPRNGKCTYTLEENKNLPCTSGCQTNEGCTKMLLQMQKIDQIICILSKTVLEKRIGKNCTEKADKVANMTAYIYYKSQISRFALSHGYTKEEIDKLYYELPIEDDPSTSQIQSSVVEAMEKMLESREPCNVYIDANGGQRHISTILIAISRLAKLHNITIKGIYTTRVVSGEEGEREDAYHIVNNLKAYDIFNLASAIDEFVDSARVDRLEDIFKNKSNEIDGLLKEMRNLSNSMLMCQSGLIQSNIATLHDKIDEFMDIHKQAAGDDEKLFKHALSYVSYAYRIVFNNSDLLSIILWCLEKGYVQQAVTLYVERLPKELADRKIFYVSEEVKKAYKEAKKNSSNKKHYKNCEDNYGILVKFLPYNCRSGCYTKPNTFGNYIGKDKIFSNISEPNQNQKKRTVNRILKSYYKIKNERNKIAHASDTNQSSDFIDDVKRSLKCAVEDLQSIQIISD